jgi:ABC-type cobalamin transport system ATPase subunit
MIAEGLAAIAPSETPAGSPDISDRLLDRLEGHRQRGPIIAVLGRTTGAQARELAAAAGFTDRALAVVVAARAGSSREAVDAFRDAGWRAVEATPRSSVPRVWAALTADDPASERAAGPARMDGSERSSA